MSSLNRAAQLALLSAAFAATTRPAHAQPVGIADNPQVQRAVNTAEKGSKIALGVAFTLVGLVGAGLVGEIRKDPRSEETVVR